MKRLNRHKRTICPCRHPVSGTSPRTRPAGTKCGQFGPRVVISPDRDMSSADSVHGLIRSASAAMDECPEALIIDCSDVEHADSAFAASLVLLTRIARTKTVSLRIQGMVGAPLAVLQVLGVSSVLATLGVIAEAATEQIVIAT